MDEYLFQLVNQYNGRWPAFDVFVDLLTLSHFKAGPITLLLWALWFRPNDEISRQSIRTGLTSALIITLPLILIGRLLAELLPFKHRPIHTPDFAVNMSEFQTVMELNGWSSMPSDHAVLFFGLATALLWVNRKAAVFAFAWTLVIICLPRIFFGWHWPSDIAVGALIGIATAALLFIPIKAVVGWSGIIPYFEARPWVGYPILFFLTYELTQMFPLAREIVSLLFEGQVG